MIEAVSDLEAGGAVSDVDRTILVVGSGLTDTRALRAWLNERGLAYEELTLHMNDPGQRRRYHEVCAQTGWQTLPQIFVGGVFVGGEQELRKLIESRPSAAPDGTGNLVASRRAMRVLGALGYLSALPFALACLALLMLPDHSVSIQNALLAYGAVILSFLGAVHWGRILDADPGAQVSVATGLLAVMPALFGWGTLLLSPVVSLPVQAILFVAVFAVDRIALRELSLGSWYVRLRDRLTTAVVILLLLTWIIVISRA